MRFLAAAVVSAAVILSSPFIRDIRDWIRTQFPGHFVTVVAVVVSVTIAAAVLAALLRIRERRLLRYAAIAAALVLGTSYALWNAQGIPDVDVVERFHFIEYGLIALLFYRAFRPLDDASIFVLPILAGLLVGTLEEWLQWFIPGRVGDMRDVFLNGAAIVSGLLFSLGLDPPPRLSLRLNPGSLRRIGVTSAIVIAVFAAFVHTVHLGYEIVDPEIGRFRSRYDAPTLAALSADRAALWKNHPPIERPASRSREDQYMSEALLHVSERNRRFDSGGISAAWSENLILERYYAPVLDAPSYISRTGHRWPDAQRNDAATRGPAMRGSSAPPYESLADVAEGRHFLRLWPKPTFWAIVVAGILLILVVTFVLDRPVRSLPQEIRR